MNPKEEEKKSLVLRLSKNLWKDMVQWAEDDFRSLNGQIEFILTDAVKKRKKKAKEGDESE